MPLASRVISTLCLNRLRSLDRIDISGRKRPSLTLPCGTQSLPYGHDNCGQLVFPPDTRGFLYYYTPPKAPPLAGEVRFRLASDLDSFHDGTDLLSIDKIPWSISLFDLANLSAHLRLREQLLADGLVSQATLDKWAGNKPPLLYERYRVGRNRIVLYYLRQPFFLRFNANFIVFNTATREQIGLCIMQNPLKDKHFEPNSHTRYSGSGLVQLEPYKDKLTLRVVKILESVQDHDGYVYRPTPSTIARRSFKPLCTKDALMLPVNFEDLP
ncbi:hypothetical protein AX14_010127 [Amanita brunnescens Koide BX004]|nr:hypothetical protein AX14_010127 [Amanita brunnescens Koide BX004]